MSVPTHLEEKEEVCMCLCELNILTKIDKHGQDIYYNKFLTFHIVNGLSSNNPL